MIDKVLFLDIDGVLNSFRSAHAFGEFPHGFDDSNYAKFDHVAVALIRRLCKDSGAKIVLSSSWRVIHRFEEVGLKLDLPIIDRTPSLNNRGRIRGDEIKYWLDFNKCSCYAIVDDDGDMLEEQLPYFVRTSIENGLSYENYLQLNSLLEGNCI